MSDKDEKKEVDKTDEFEKRYNDSQSHIVTLEKENKDMRDTAQKEKELLDAVTPYVDWAAVNGTKAEPTSDSEALVDQKTLNDKFQALENKITTSNNTQAFRTKYPDMVEYEDLVSVYFQKTDTRRPFNERLKKAVENTRTLLESEQTKGRESDEKEKQ